MARKSLGRQKIPMERVRNENHLQVTFSKRRLGLLNKASELSVLCGAHVALLIFSPGDRVFSFGHPSVGSVIERYLLTAPAGVEVVVNTPEVRALESEQATRIGRLYEEVARLEGLLEAEKKRGEALDEMIRKAKKEAKEKKLNMGWRKPIEDLDQDQLLEFRKCLENVKEKLDEKVRVDREVELAEEARLTLQLGLPEVAAAVGGGGGGCGTNHPGIDLNRSASDDGEFDDVVEISDDDEDEAEPRARLHKFI